MSASLAWGFNSRWLFDYGFQKYNVSQSTGLPDTELAKLGKSWTDYINSGNEFWTVSVTNNGKTFMLFTQDEQIHFRDVKQLIWLDYRILLITLIVVLGYALTLIFWRRGRSWNLLAHDVIWGSGLAVLLIVALGIGSFLDFEQLFLQLHGLIFTNSYWSAAGYMLLLFPGGFWFDAALICISFMAGLSIILGGLAFTYLKLTSGKAVRA
jgi:integral membrane protein (TIGR01906 family)